MRQFFKYIFDATKDTHIERVLYSLLLAEPVTAFIYGVIKCSDCGINPISYLFMGVVATVFSIITAGGLVGTGFLELINFWPFVPFSALFIWLGLWVASYVMARPNLAVKRDCNLPPK